MSVDQYEVGYSIAERFGHQPKVVPPKPISGGSNNYFNGLQGV